MKTFLLAMLFLSATPSILIAQTPLPLKLPPDLLAHLADPQFTIRQQAQQELENIPRQDREALQKLSDDTTNPEVRASLKRRLHEIDEQLLIDPLPISIDLQNASLEQTAIALTRATGSRFSAPGGDSRHFTLHAQNQQLWKVVEALSSQNHFSLMPGQDNTFSLWEGDPGFQHVTHSFGLAIFDERIVYVVPDPKGAEKYNSIAHWNLNFTILADPRLEVISSLNPCLTDVVDDAGNVLLHHTASTMPGGWCMGCQNTVFMESESLVIPDKPGKKIASAKGQFQFVTATAATTLRIPDFQKNAFQPIKIGGRAIAFSEFKSTREDSIQCEAAVSYVDENNPPPSEDILEMTLSDSTGMILFKEPVYRDSFYESAMGRYTPPFTALFYSPTQTKIVTIPFELKDIPLP